MGIDGSAELRSIASILIICNLVFKVAVCIVEDLFQDHEQQYVGVLIQFQLLAVVFHWQHIRQRNTQEITQLAGLKQ